MQVNVMEAKTEFSKLIRLLESKREDSIIVARNGRPVVKMKHFLGESSLKWNGEGEVHKDPYDRLLLSQAKNENLRFMTHDEMIQRFDEKCIIAV